MSSMAQTLLSTRPVGKKRSRSVFSLISVSSPRFWASYPDGAAGGVSSRLTKRGFLGAAVTNIK
jgi:hypothetical protein